MTDDELIALVRDSVKVDIERADKAVDYLVSAAGDLHDLASHEVVVGILVKSLMELQDPSIAAAVAAMAAIRLAEVEWARGVE